MFVHKSHTLNYILSVGLYPTLISISASLCKTSILKLIFVFCGDLREFDQVQALDTSFQATNSEVKSPAIISAPPIAPIYPRNSPNAKNAITFARTGSIEKIMAALTGVVSR